LDHGVGAYHLPVLLEQAVALLLTDPDGIYVDGTVGGGGHSSLILRRLGARGRLLGFDQDADAMREAGALASDGRMTLVHDNVARLPKHLSRLGITALDGILLDLGVSSHQLDAPQRGFSFRHDGPLDMRMDTTSTRTAADLLADSGEEELARIFFTYGEERRSRRIAAAVVRARARGPIATTAQLVEVVERAAPGPHPGKTLARVFQALRIAVNDELGVLEHTLQAGFEALRTGGRMVVISYHSLEDRLVKTCYRAEAATCVCPPRTPVCICGKVARMRILTTKHLSPADEEIERNPRARSARLRAGEKIHA
jgi:16S rRNA (cytosine1402-N4)-methyltransferase